MDQEIFRPVRGTEDSILSSLPHKGYVYFATDTKKIYYSDGESFLLIGGNTGIWYGKKPAEQSEDPSQVEFEFKIYEIEGNEDFLETGKYNLPNKNDLIFNSDHCFYKVIDISIEDEVPTLYCEKLTVAGGSGGDGGDGRPVGSMTISRIGDQIINAISGQDCFIEYNYSAVDASGDQTGNGLAILYVNGISQGTYTVYQGSNSIKINDFFRTGVQNYSIKLVVSGSIGGIDNITQSKTWTVILNSLTLNWDYNNTQINTGSTFTFNWSVSSSLQYITHVNIDNTYNFNVEYRNIRNRTHTINTIDWGLTHGSHTVKMWVTTEIGDKTLFSNIVSHSVICAEEGETTTIISIDLFQNEMNQYDTLSIPIVLYDPTTADTTNTVSVTLSENEEIVSEWKDYQNGEQYYWNYTPITPGLKKLIIANSTIEKTILLMVNSLNLDIEEVPDYEFKFKASDISDNSVLKTWKQDSITTSFSENFDWINGGLKDEKDENGNKRNYVGIKVGNTMTFNYQPLKNVDREQGFTIKVIFKATDCRDYDATILTIGNSSDNVYFTLKANEGIFKSNNSKITVPYCEDSYIEFEVDVWPINGQHYLMTWINGVPASASTYDETDQFNSSANRNIVIGSEDCSVQLYLLKIYQKHLSFEEHLSNFIMDAPNALEILNRYNRNNILDNNGRISYSKLIEKNPECDVYLYEIPRMTTTKKDKVEGCHYERYKASSQALQTAENVTMAVQGTSSAAYGLAAFNFNSTFEDGFTDYSTGEAQHIDKWAMSEGAIPIDDFNTKVNVASCEGVNNALNQAEYDRLVNHVYTTEYKIKKPNSRHTMQFMNMGVVFIKDKNPNIDKQNGVENNIFNDTLGYVETPNEEKPYLMYSICNMGNIKRNAGVFSDPENPYDVIMEVPDNQSVYQQMTGLLDENNKLKGRWIDEKFYPVMNKQGYDKTLDKEIDSNKTYYIRSNDEYIEVLEPVKDELKNYYEHKNENDIAATEVFEWRATPSVWENMGEAIKPETFNNQPNTKTMRELANDAWTDLVAWFAANNPNAATDEDLPEEEVYEAYTFKGYTSIPDRIDKNGNSVAAYSQNNSILRGLTIDTYADTYTKDTKERRMAKLLNECEDHLIMDEIVFHYLFIERHCLIDNVAKNTFWHTEDLQHWSMIKDYDNDTSDGNDNSGHLTLTYGYEVLDHVDHDESKSFVFNAASSVWLHFINGLLPARIRMYQYLDSSNIAAWDAEPYLQLFDSWQSRVPERVWIEDYRRKYLRPLEVYGATQFLPMLEGGKKTYQRKQFEIYQEAYMASEYFGRKCQNSLIDIRANGSNINEMEFPITMYADCYIRAAAGSGHDPNVRERYRKGETAYITLPVTGDANDMTTYFYLANYITSLSNIEKLKPKKVDISAAIRLKEFSMTGIEGGEYYQKTEDIAITSGKKYYQQKYVLVESPNEEYLESYYEIINNEYELTKDTAIINEKSYYTFEGYEEVLQPDIANINSYYEKIISNQNLNLTTLDFKGNKMLETLRVNNCPSISQSLDLTASTNLKTLDVRNSGFTGITLAKNAPIETLYLNNPTTLSFTNLFNVENFSISYDRLNTLLLDNIDNSEGIKSNLLVENAISKFIIGENEPKLSYDLQNVNWIINEQNKVSDTEISILESLLQKGNPQDGNKLIDKSQALSGTLIISSNAYKGEHSLDLYNKYSINSQYNFPNLDIVFEDENAKLYNIIIKNGNDEIVWIKKSRNYILNEDFLSSGPMGTFDKGKTIVKTSTYNKVYSFANQWEIQNADDSTDKIIINNENAPYYETALNKNIIITPIFTEADREYTVTFYNYDDTEIEPGSGKYPYNTPVGDIEPAVVPRKDDSDLDPYYTYAFKGYAFSKTATEPLNLENQRVDREDLKYYAIYGEAVDTNSSDNVHEKNFKFTYSSGIEDPETGIQSGPGYKISPAEGIQLIGKITIPAKYNNLPILSVSGFGAQNSDASSIQRKITGIYFEAGSEIKVFDDWAFANMSQLKYLEIPDSIREIHSGAIYNLPNLKLIPREKINGSNTIYVLGGKNLYSIQQEAFVNCIDQDCTKIIIPASLTKASAKSFANFNNAVHLKVIDIGNINNGTNLEFNLGKYEDSQLSYFRFNNQLDSYPKSEGTSVLATTIYLSPDRINNLDLEIIEKMVSPYGWTMYNSPMTSGIWACNKVRTDQ